MQPDKEKVTEGSKNSRSSWHDAIMRTYVTSEELDILERKAEQGDVETQYRLGKMYGRIGSVLFFQDPSAELFPRTDHKKGTHWYKKAAEQGHVQAQYRLAYRYVTGRGVAQNDTRAARWYEKAAKQGHKEAQFEIGQMYYKGQGVVLNDTKAAFWYQKAAEQGHAGAQFSLATMYMYEEIGSKDIKKDEEKAKFWFEKAAKQGHADAQFYFGLLAYLKPVNHEQIMFWCKKAAENGSMIAQLFLGGAYTEGKVCAQDDKEALRWYKKAGLSIGQNKIYNKVQHNAKRKKHKKASKLAEQNRFLKETLTDLKLQLKKNVKENMILKLQQMKKETSMKNIYEAMGRQDIKRVEEIIAQAKELKDVSLITMYEKLISEKFKAKDLRTQGALLTLNGLKARIDSVLSGTDGPVSREQMKRLSGGLKELLRAWTSGRLANKDARKTLDVISRSALAALSKGKISLNENLVGSAVLQKLMIAKQEASLHKVFSDWKSKGLSGELTDALTQKFTQELYMSWKHYSHIDEKTLKEVLTKAEQRAKVDSFKLKVYPDALQKDCDALLQRTLLSKAEGGALEPLMGVLTQEVERIREEEYGGKFVLNQTPLFKKASLYLIMKWRKGQLTKTEGQCLEGKVAEVLRRVQLTEEAGRNNSRQACRLVVEDYLHQKLFPAASKALEEYLSNNLRQLVVKKTKEESADFKGVLQYLATVRVDMLLSAWRGDELSQEVSQSLQKLILPEFYEQLAGLNERLYPTISQADLRKLQQTVEKQSQQIAQLQQLMQQLAPKVEFDRGNVTHSPAPSPLQGRSGGVARQRLFGQKSETSNSQSAQGASGKVPTVEN